MGCTCLGIFSKVCGHSIVFTVGYDIRAGTISEVKCSVVFVRRVRRQSGRCALERAERILTGNCLYRTVEVKSVQIVEAHMQKHNIAKSSNAKIIARYKDDENAA